MSAPSAQPTRVLVVVADSGLQNTFEVLLSEGGYEPHVVATLGEALARMASPPSPSFSRRRHISLDPHAGARPPARRRADPDWPAHRIPAQCGGDTRCRLCLRRADAVRSGDLPRADRRRPRRATTWRASTAQHCDRRVGRPHMPLISPTEDNGQHSSIVDRITMDHTAFTFRLLRQARDMMEAARQLIRAAQSRSRPPVSGQSQDEHPPRNRHSHV